MKETRSSTTSATFPDSRPHYLSLDGLRGIAALLVVWYHVFEGFATSPLDQIINHGYLAVDFFFILSGFVIGYAYDHRLKQGMSRQQFALRRLIRLHPMVIVGAILGGLLFYTQGCSWWDVASVSVSALLGAVLLNAFLVPATPKMEIRGIGEMYPLNGPSWSLFFEYIAYIGYALIIRHLPKWGLALVILLSGLGLGYFVHTTGSIGVGWTMLSRGMLGGIARVFFSFTIGLLVYRSIKPGHKSYGFWFGAVAIVSVCALPRLGGEESPWINGLYELICVGLLFPTIVYLGASTPTSNPKLIRLYKFLGDISYPLYIVHYPFIYLYIAWVKNEKLTFLQSLPGALALFFGCITLAYLCLKVYDEPARRWLSKRL